MTAKPVALLLATLGVVPSHSRPQVSDDSPFSEAQFKTLIWLWSMNGAKEYVGDTR
jgi:putative transposase